MEHQTTTWNGEPAIRVRLDYDEARKYLALDEDEIAYLDSLTASERDKMILELDLVPLREVAGYAIGTTGKPTEHLPSLTAATTTWTEDDYDGALSALEGIDRAAYQEVLDQAARIIARGVRAYLLDYRQELRDAIPEPDCYQIRGYVVLEGTAKNFGGTAHVTVPRKYSGKRVKIVVLDP